MARHKEIYQTQEWKRLRRYILARDQGLCQECKRRGRIRAGQEVHHIIELTEENKHDRAIAYNPENLETLCSDCHNAKHDRDIGLKIFIEPVKIDGN